MKQYLLFALIFSLSGCLLTHKEIMEDRKRSGSEETQDWSDLEEVNVKEKNKKTDNTSPTKKESLPTHSVSVTERFSQIDTSLRELRGQIENIKKEQKDRIDQMEQGLLALIQALELQIAALANKAENKQESKPEEDTPENSFEKAEKFFKEENWKAAIINYEKYREINKKGDFYKQSTFQIGICFQKLGMLKEAKVFFREIVESFPNSTEAKEAKKLLATKTKKPKKK